MEKLKQVRDKFNKIPQIFIYFIVIAACAYASIPSVFVVDQYLADLGLDYTMTGLSAGTFQWVAFVFGAIVSWALIELVIAVIHNMSSSRRFLIQGQSNLFKNTIRMGYILTQILIGSYNMLNFVQDEVIRLHFTFATDIVSFVVNCIVFTFVYLLLKKDVIRGDKVFSLYYMLFNIYVVFQILSKSLTFFSALFLFDGVSMAEKVYSSINLLLVIAASIILYIFVYKKSREEQISYIANIKAEEEINKNKDDIFGGYDL